MLILEAGNSLNMSLDYTELLKTFQPLFKGREDVFAVRWEKDGKSGYMPAYDVDWPAYNLHKANGGTFQDFDKKTLVPLSGEQMLKHFRGEQFIGIYPLLPDNTSWFIAADFDEKNWIDEVTRFLKACNEVNLPAYLERSRSGKGGHVWLFFEKPYPASKSRKIISALLERAGVISALDKSSSFDRLFPNQDYHSGKGLGNLIALPLHKKSHDQGNSCFIDPVTLFPFEDQLQFLKNISRVTEAQLEDIYLSIETLSTPSFEVPVQSDGKLSIILDNKLRLSRKGMTILLMGFLKEELNFLNSEYLLKKKLGKNPWGTTAYFKLIEESETTVALPKGMVGKVLRFCKTNKIKFEFKDCRKKLTPILFSSGIQLKDYQQPIVEATRKKDIGIISAPPGSGKTVMGLAIIVEKQQPALIIVHRQQLFDQWIERIQSFLKIPRHEIGIIGEGVIKPGKKITVAMIQSLSKAMLNNDQKLQHLFGTILVDECHHIPALTYKDTIEKFDSYYLYGLTATPFRKHNDEKILFAYLGEVIAEIKPQAVNKNKEATIVIRETALDVPFNQLTDKAETLFKILVHDSARNGLILSDIEKELIAGRKTVVITERKEHIDVLHQYLKQSYEVIRLSGDDNEAEKTRKWNLLRKGDFEVLATTGQLFGEGSDLASIDCLFLVYPFSFEGKLVQYIGRVERAELAPIIYDYRDVKIEYLEKLFQKRNVYYRRLRKQGGLKQDQEIVATFNGTQVSILGSNDMLDLRDIGLPDSVEEFPKETNWLLRVLKFDEDSGILFTEILSYGYQMENRTLPNDLFAGIKKINFRSIDTARLLLSLASNSRLTYKIPLLVTEVPTEKPTQVIEETIKVPINAIEFGYGTFKFGYFCEQLYERVTLEIENHDIRPEFEVLKPYFCKAIKSKKVNVGIRLEIQGTRLVSKSATSFDLERINQEVIDGVKFNFVSKDVLQAKPVSPDRAGLMGLSESMNPDKNKTPLYQSEQAFLDDLLRWKNVRHYHQLKYLAQRHEASSLKIRFVLSPFSFLFLIAGIEKYHIILETLDTEEATYIWHVEKETGKLVEQLQVIDKAIHQIREQGRQTFLSTNAENFSRILHDYSDAKKGFILWKGLIEERLL